MHVVYRSAGARGLIHHFLHLHLPLLPLLLLGDWKEKRILISFWLGKKISSVKKRFFFTSKGIVLVQVRTFIKFIIVIVFDNITGVVKSSLWNNASAQEMADFKVGAQDLRNEKEKIKLKSKWANKLVLDVLKVWSQPWLKFDPWLLKMPKWNWNKQQPIDDCFNNKHSNTVSNQWVLQKRDEKKNENVLPLGNRDRLCCLLALVVDWRSWRMNRPALVLWLCAQRRVPYAFVCA